MMLSGATRSVGEIWLLNVPGSDSTEAPCSKGAVRLAGVLRSGAGCSGTGMTCWLRGVAIGGSLGTPTARPEDAAVGTAAGIGGACANGEDASRVTASSVRIMSKARILRNIWVRDLLKLD